jgi:hypothetical protein
MNALFVLADAAGAAGRVFALVLLGRAHGLGLPGLQAATRARPARDGLARRLAILGLFCLGALANAAGSGS